MEATVGVVILSIWLELKERKYPSVRNGAQGQD